MKLSLPLALLYQTFNLIYVVSHSEIIIPVSSVCVCVFRAGPVDEAGSVRWLDGLGHRHGRLQRPLLQSESLPTVDGTQ